jgi:mono/diheme cytochrome c family protein
MRISSSQMFRDFNKWCIGAISIMMLSGSFSANAQDGEGLFKSKCATCHQPHKDNTGPKLYDVRTRWAEGAGDDKAIYKWVNNWESAAATIKYAKEVSGWAPNSAMTQFPDLTEEQITAIFDYVDAQPDPATLTAGASNDGGGAITEEESSNQWIWILCGVIFITIIMAVGGVRRQLKIVTSEAEGKPVKHGMTYTEEFRTWAWKNRKFAGFIGAILFISLLVSLFLGLYSIGTVENYQPSQPIDFPHSVHAGTNGIDCKYCHNTVTESRTASLPSVNVCMNCHKQVNGTTSEQQEKINKIYEAAGWDKEGAGKYTGKTKEIVWNKVHVLPDHVYFNHQQHVVVGQLDCKQCHGDMTKQKETQKVWPVEELNKIEGNVQLTAKTLTMGWCIECHATKEISAGPLDTKEDGYYNEIHKRLVDNDKTLYESYLKDGKVTVSELGGWECAKCHY